MRVGPTFLWEVSLSSTIEFRRIKIYEKLGDLFWGQDHREGQNEEREKIPRPKISGEQLAIKSNGIRHTSLFALISIDCHKIYEIRNKKIFSPALRNDISREGLGISFE